MCHAALISALEQADQETARDLLLEAWRARPDIAVAEALQHLSVGFLDALDGREINRLQASLGVWLAVCERDDDSQAELLIASLRLNPQGSVRQLAALLLRRPDPRIAWALAERILVWRDGPEPVNSVLADVLRGIPDGRIAGVLDAHLLLAKPIRQLLPHLKTLAAEQESTEPVLHSVQQRWPAPELSAETTLFQQVWADPTSSEAKLVLADVLQERGDPRGRLIALQMQPEPSRAARKEARQLIAQHWRGWLGSARWALVSEKLRFEAGFPVSGVLHAESIWPIIEATGAPEWHTFRHLEVRGWAPFLEHLVCDPTLAGLQVLRGRISLDVAAALNECGHAKLRVLEVRHPDNRNFPEHSERGYSGDAATLERFCRVPRRLAALEEVHFVCPFQPVAPHVRRLFEAPLMSGLLRLTVNTLEFLADWMALVPQTCTDRLCVVDSHFSVEVHRTDGGWTRAEIDQVFGRLLGHVLAVLAEVGSLTQVELRLDEDRHGEAETAAIVQFQKNRPDVLWV